MNTAFQECLQEAAKGRRLVHSYYSRHGGDGKGRVVVLIFPDDDPRLLAAVARYLNRFLHELYYDAAVVLSSVDLGYDVRSLTSKPVYIYDINESDMAAILRFQSFDIKPNGIYDIKVFSFRMPFHVRAEALIGFKDVTAEAFTFYSLFGMVSGAEES